MFETKLKICDLFCFEFHKILTNEFAQFIISLQCYQVAFLQVSRTLLSILANFNTVVCMVLILPLISYSSKLLETVPSTPATVSITHHVPQLFKLSSKVQVFSIFSFSGLLEQQNPLNDKFFFFFFFFFFFPS